MTDFTPGPAAAGGALIGLAAVLLMITTGRIAGVSGFLSRLLPPYEDRQWIVRAAFVAGLVVSPLLYRLATGSVVDFAVTPSMPLLAIAGVLVGIGTVLGGGCTSGHGVCGTARLSARSIVATLVFMATGVATVFIARHVLGG